MKYSFFLSYFFFFWKTSSTALDNAIMNANPFNSDRLVRMYSNVDVYVREGARYLIFLILLISAYTYRRNVSVFQKKNMIVFKFLYYQSNYIDMRSLSCQSLTYMNSLIGILFFFLFWKLKVGDEYRAAAAVQQRFDAPFGVYGMKNFVSFWNLFFFLF